MNGKIAFEEHYGLQGEIFENFTMNTSELTGGRGKDLQRRLLETENERLEAMDRAGVELSILSFTAPGAQGEPNTARAIEGAIQANDWLAETVLTKHPDRYAGFAVLPLQDPEAAINELERCVHDLNFKGAMVNGFSNIGDKETGVYLDDSRYLPFWEKVQALDVPIYLHPRDSLPSQQLIYKGHEALLRAAWGWGFETGTHALRLMMSGLFDRYPLLKIVLGHMGETLPFALSRAESRLAFSGADKGMQKKLSRYFQENFYITTSGNCRTQAFLNTLLEVSGDHVLFSTDYPYENMVESAAWFDNLPISDIDRMKIGRTNAIELFKLEEFEIDIDKASQYIVSTASEKRPWRTN